MYMYVYICMYVCMYVYVSKAAQRNFIESMAAYAVVCYLLKVSLPVCLCVVCVRESMAWSATSLRSPAYPY